MRGALVVLLALALAGCGVAPPRPDTAGQRLSVAEWQPPAAPSSWRLRGRAAVRVPDDSGTLSVDWRQDGERYRLDLRGTLGAGAVRLEGRPGSVVLTTADGERLEAASARELLAAETGFDLPVARLVWWLRGQPVPGLSGSVTLDARGRPATLRQDGWRIQYDRWTDVDGYELPGRLSVKRDGIRLRVAVAQWETGA